MLCPDGLQSPELQTLQSGHPKGTREKELFGPPTAACRSALSRAQGKDILLLSLSCSILCSILSDSSIFWIAAHQGSLSFAISWSLLKFISIELVMPSNHFLLLPSIFPSIRIFSNEVALHIRWPNYRASLVAQMVKTVPAVWEIQD